MSKQRDHGLLMSKQRSGVLPALEIHILGDFRLVYAGQLVTSVSSPRLQSLLAYLVLHRAAPQSRRHLAFLLWPDSTEAQARTNLRYLLHQLRQALPAPERFLAADAQTLQWRPDAPFTLDVDAFERGLALATSVASLREAVDHYRGVLLPSCYDDWILPDREHLWEMFIGALDKLTRLLEDQGDYHAAIQYTQLLLRHDSLREETYRQLMRLHALSGDRTGVRRAFQTCEIVLKRELDAEVSAATREAYEQLLKPAARPERAGVPPARARHHNLPIHLTSFIGRERAIADLSSLLSKQTASQHDVRLLTLTGTGGCGNTRLALQAAGGLLDAYSDGVWLVELAPLADPALVPQAVAAVLGVREQQGRTLTESLSLYLESKALLLVLDNVEHLSTASARLAEAILQACAHVQIFATSRERLNVAGEAVWLVPALSLPPAEQEIPFAELQRYEAIHLFVERAAAALPTFELTQPNARLVTQICRSLDGIPLAIELAAARVKTLTVEQISERLVERFRLLIGGSRTALPKHQTLRATMDWSYVLLSMPERVLFRRLAVFAGGWTLEAAEQICGEAPSAEDVTINILAGLTDKSLVIVEERAGRIRYRLLETVRQYAGEKLMESGESELIRDSHLAFFLQMAEEAEPHLTGPAQATWFTRLEKDYANLRAAHEWSLQEPDASHGMRLATALETLWYVRGPATEGVDWLVRAVSRSEAAAGSLVRAKALLATARLLWITGEPVRSNRYIEESLAISRALEYRPGIARALYLLGMNARLQGDLKTSISLLEQSLAIREGLDSDAIVRIYQSLGLTAEVEGDYDAARGYLEQAMTVAQAAEDSHSVAFTFARLGALAFLRLDYDGAGATFEQGLNASRAIGYSGVMALSSRDLAYVALRRGQVERAAALCQESLLTNRERRDPLGLAASLAACAALAVARGHPERSARLYGSAAARLVGNVGGGHRWPHDETEQERQINILRSHLDEATFNAAWEAGRTLTPEQTIDYALEPEND
jgi:predicted ATPase/DNA-binding SARP family transcriptional activator